VVEADKVAVQRRRDRGRPGGFAGRFGEKCERFSRCWSGGRKFHGIELRQEEFTVAQMIAALRAQILARRDNSVNLIQFFEACPQRHAMIVAFLGSVLEMVKLQAVALAQENQFGGNCGAESTRCLIWCLMSRAG